MEILISAFQGGFKFLTDCKLFDIPLLYILIGMAVLGLVISFVAGRKE